MKPEITQLLKAFEQHLLSIWNKLLDYLFYYLLCVPASFISNRKKWTDLCLGLSAPSHQLCV